MQGNLHPNFSSALYLQSETRDQRKSDHFEQQLSRIYSAKNPQIRSPKYYHETELSDRQSTRNDTDDNLAPQG